MSGKLSERKIARLLAEREEHEPPEGLLERIRAEIPPLEALDLSPLRDGRVRRGRFLHRLPATWLAAASIVFACIGGVVFWQLAPKSSSLPEEIGPGEMAPVSPKVPPPPPPPMPIPQGAEPEPGADAVPEGSAQEWVAPQSDVPVAGLSGSAARQLQPRRRDEADAAAPPVAEEVPITTTADLLERHRQQEPASEADAKAKAPSGRVNAGGNERGTPSQGLRPVPPPPRPPIPAGVVGGGGPAPAAASPPPPPKPPESSVGAARGGEEEAPLEIAPADKPSPRPSTVFDTRHPKPAQAFHEAFPPPWPGARRPPQCEGGVAPWAGEANRFVLRIAAAVPASPPSALDAEARAASDELERSKADRRAAAESRLEKKETEREGSLEAGPSVRFDPQSVLRVRRLGEERWRKAGGWEALAAAAGVEPLALFEIEVRPGARSEQLVAQVRSGGAIVREVRLAELARRFADTSSELQLSVLQATLAKVAAGTLHLSPDELRALNAAARRAAGRWPDDRRSRELRIRTEPVAPP